MGNAKFALKMLKLEYKKTFFYGLALICSSAVIFLFFNYMDNPYLGNSINGGKQFSNILALGLMLISCATACFANGFFLSKKNGEIAIYTMSGAGIGGVSIYLIVQNFVIILFTLPLGFILGSLLTPLLNWILYQSMHIQAPLYIWSNEAFVMSIISLITQTAALTVVNAGYAYRHDILQLLNANRTMQAEPPASSIRMPIFVYWITAFLPLIVFFQINVYQNDTMPFLVASCVGLYGVSGLFKRGFPKLFEKIQKKFNLTKKINLIGMGNLSYAISRTASLIKIIIVALITMICLCISYYNDPKTRALIFFSYGIIIFLMCICILYRIMVENASNGPLYLSLYKLGFIKKDLLSIMKFETIGIYGIVLFIPTLYNSVILGIFVAHKIIPLTTSIILILVYIIPFVLIGFFTYNQYKKTIFEYLEGGEDNG